MTQRKKRANGLASREAILDAAEQIAGERGYEATSITLVSKHSGLPASSIYWHFENKDQLIAAVIDRSFTAWIDAVTAVPALPAGGGVEADFVAVMRHAGARLAEFPDFLRLGITLILDQRADEPAARQRFHASRFEMLGRLEPMYRAFFTGLDDAAIHRLARFTLAGADGLFVAANDEALSLVDEFALLAHAVLGAARGLGWTPPD